MSLADYNLVCLQNQISRCFTNDYMVGIRQKVSKRGSNFGGQENYNAIVESLNWLICHRSKCERLTAVGEEQMMIKTY